MRHKFQSALSDPADGTLIKPSNWNDVHRRDSRVISSNATGVATDDLVLATAGSSGITYCLPLTPFDGQEVQVFKTDGASGTVSVTGSSIGSLGSSAATSYGLSNQNQRAAFTWTAALSGWLVSDDN